jgi:hypothetical protein
MEENPKEQDTDNNDGDVLASTTENNIETMETNQVVETSESLNPTTVVVGDESKEVPIREEVTTTQEVERNLEPSYKLTTLKLTKQ